MEGRSGPRLSSDGKLMVGKGPNKEAMGLLCGDVFSCDLFPMESSKVHGIELYLSESEVSKESTLSIFVLLASKDSFFVFDISSKWLCKTKEGEIDCPTFLF